MSWAILKIALFVLFGLKMNPGVTPPSLKESLFAQKFQRWKSGAIPKFLRFIVRDRKKGSLRKGVFSLAESLESLKSLDSLESLENGRILLCFPQSGGSLETLESLNSLEFLENGLF